MDTAERTTASEATTYDGFISYSHAADGLFAPRLQSALQSFAKPWWKRRAVRLFRDESSLSANPHLWSSITEALDESAWFVLLLSPEAAASPWVNQEIEYWLEHKSPDQVLPVVTDGEFAWDGDLQGDAVPGALERVFAEEPRWVDARALGNPESLDLNHPGFAAVVADLAAPLRGMAKDELASEEVRQHKRTVRTAWAAGVAVLALAVAAAGFGVQSARNAVEAERQASIADENAQQAHANAEEARRQEAAAEKNAEAEADARADADRAATLARGRELASTAVVAANEDAQLSLLLALSAIDALPEGIEPGPVLENGLRTAMEADRLLARYDAHEAAGPSQIDLSPDGELVAFVAAGSNIVELLDAETLDPLWSRRLDTQDVPLWVAFSSTGRFVVVSLADAHWEELRPFVDGEPDGEPDARFVVLDTSDGSTVHTQTVPGACVVNLTPGGFREDLGLLGFGFEGCGRGEAPGTIRFLETDGWTTVYERKETGNSAHVVFADEGPVAAVFSGFNTGTDSWLLDTSTWEVIRPIDYPWGDLSPDGGLLAGSVFEAVSGVMLETTDSGELRDRFTQDLQFPWDPEFSPDGSRLAYATLGDVTFIYDPSTGDELQEMRTGQTERAAFDGEFLYTVWHGVVSRWDSAGLLAGDLNTEPLGLWVNGNSIRWAGDTIYAVVADRSNGDWFFYPVGADGSLAAPIAVTNIAPGVDDAPGEGSDTSAVEWNTPISEGRVAVFRRRELDQVGAELGPLEFLDLSTGEFSVVAGCWMDEAAAYRHESCPDGSPHPAGQLATARRDGNEFMVIDYSEEEEVPAETFATIWDANTLAISQRISLGELNAPFGQLQASVLTDRYVVVHIGGNQEVKIFDRSTGVEVDFDQGLAEPYRGMEHDRSQNRIWAGGQGDSLWVLDLDDFSFEQVTEPLPSAIRALASSPSGEQVAVGGADNVLRIFSDEGALLHIIPIQNPSDAWWLDETHLVVGTGNGPWTTITLESDELVQIAKSRVRRGFTNEECEFYGLEPCPTLEELRDG